VSRGKGFLSHLKGKGCKVRIYPLLNNPLEVLA